MDITKVGEGRVYLLSGGGKVYTDIAARFCKSERPVLEIVDSPYSEKIVRTIIDSGHLAATEFDFFVFAVEGYSRVTEAQLVRKRMASYLIKSGRAELGGKRAFSMVLPERVAQYEGIGNHMAESERLYNAMVADGIPEEEARFIKPQATEFRAIIGMNAHALLDWFGIRCCNNAQSEIRDMAWKMLRLARDAAPDIFKDAGPRCRTLGYCPEVWQNEKCKGKILNRQEAMERLKA